MVKITVEVASFSNVSVECSVEDCASLLLLLQKRGNAPPPRVGATEQQCTTETVPSTQAMSASHPPAVSQSQKPLEPHPAPPPIAKKPVTTSGRRYGGDVTRRDLILNAFREREAKGYTASSLDDICRHISNNDPEQDIKLLKQAIRDLHSKKALLERCGRGVFRTKK